MPDEVQEQQSTILTPEENLSVLSDNLICSVIGSDDVAKDLRSILFGQLNEQVFRDENYVIYSVLYNFKDKGITPDTEFLKMYLMRNQKFLKESQQFINLTEFADLDENPIIGYISAVIKQFVRLQGVPTLSKDTFRLSIEKYKQEFSAFEISKAYSQSKIILYDGIQVGKRFYQGYNDSVAYIKKKIADVEAILDHTTGAGFIDSRKSAVVDNERTKPIKIGDFDLIKELNDVLGGIYTSMFYSVLAPTKGGKSKFTTRMAHTVAVKYGQNVSVYPHEGGYEAWWAQLRAIHYEYTYIRNGDSNSKVVPLSQDDILKDNYPSETVKNLEQASRLDLFTNPQYGNFYMIDRPFYAETLVDEIETSVQLNDSKLVVIDYLQLISSMDNSKSKPQYIGKAYQEVLGYCKKRNVAVVSPSQFTQEFIKDMSRSKGGTAQETRTAGGESAEIVRTPDINIALYASIEDLIRREMSIISIPSRFCPPFPDIPIYADLCSCVFASYDQTA